MIPHDFGFMQSYNNIICLHSLSVGCDVMMKMSYKKLWIMLVEKEISQATLRKDLNIATGTMTKLRRN